MKRGAMAAGALTWATPVVQAVGMNPAYAQETSPGAENCCVDAEGNTVKLAIVDMKYLGEDNFCPGAYTQDDSLVTCTDYVTPPDQLPDSVYIVASHQEFPFEADGSPKPAARIWFSGPVNKGSVFSIAASNATETVLKGETWVHVFSEDPEGTMTPLEDLYRQKVGFHTSCSEPLFTGDRFGSVEVVGCEPEDPNATITEPAAETQELEEGKQTEELQEGETPESGQEAEESQETQQPEPGEESTGAGQSTVPDQADPPGIGGDESGSEEDSSG